MATGSDTDLRKLIFYSTVGPDRDAGAWRPFTMARRAIDEGLRAEIFLAGPATGLLRRQVRERLDGRPQEALKIVLDAGVPIHYSPG